MRVLDLPDTLQTSLAAQTFEAIREARFALAGEIELARRAKFAAVHGAASALVSTKPVAQWTPEDHLTFMEASGDTRMPPNLQALVVAADNRPSFAPSAYTSPSRPAPIKTDPDIPF